MRLVKLQYFANVVILQSVLNPALRSRSLAAGLAAVLRSYGGRILLHLGSILAHSRLTGAEKRFRAVKRNMLHRAWIVLSEINALLPRHWRISAWQAPSAESFRPVPIACFP